jgi:hypothetical protein
MLAPSEARAAGYSQAHAVVANLTGAKGVHAHVEVAINTAGLQGGPVAIGFDVFGADGGALTSFEIETDLRGFASTRTAPSPNDDLFAISHGAPALVRVRFPEGPWSAGVALQYSQPRAKLRHNLSADRRADDTPKVVGRSFEMVIGEVVGVMSLLIANVSASAVNVDVFRGTIGTPGYGAYNHGGLPSRNIWRVDLQPADAGSRLVVESTGELIVQLATAQGDNLDMATLVPR